jgi:hypothetical protein
MHHLISFEQPVELLRLLLAMPESHTTRDYQGRDILALCISRPIEYMRACLEFDTRKQFDGSALVYLCQAKEPSLEKVQLLLEHYPKAASFEMPGHKSTALHYLCQSHVLNVELFGLILKSNPGALHAPNIDKWTPFQLLLQTVARLDLPEPRAPFKPAVPGLNVDGSIDSRMIVRGMPKAVEIANQQFVERYRSDLSNHRKAKERWQRDRDEQHKNRPPIDMALFETVFRYDNERQCVNVANVHTGNNALHYCCLYDMPELIPLMLQNNSGRQKALRATNKSGETPALIAQRRGDMKALAALEGLPLSKLTEASESTMIEAIVLSKPVLITALVKHDPSMLTKTLDPERGNSLSIVR